MKIAAGNPGKRATNKREPRPKAGVPVPPEHLSDRARQSWFAISPMLQSMGVLTTADGLALERLCECYTEIVELQTVIRNDGRTYTCKTKGGGKMRRAAPEVAMLADADRRFKSYLVEFGLSPAARSKVNVSEEQEEDPADKYFA